MGSFHGGNNLAIDIEQWQRPKEIFVFAQCKWALRPVHIKRRFPIKFADNGNGRKGVLSVINCSRFTEAYIASFAVK